MYNLYIKSAHVLGFVNVTIRDDLYLIARIYVHMYPYSVTSFKCLLRLQYIGPALVPPPTLGNTYKNDNNSWGTFSNFGEHFWPKFMLFCRIL